MTLDPRITPIGSLGDDPSLGHTDYGHGVGQSNPSYADAVVSHGAQQEGTYFSGGVLNLTVTSATTSTVTPIGISLTQGLSDQTQGDNPYPTEEDIDPTEPVNPDEMGNVLAKVMKSTQPQPRKDAWVTAEFYFEHVKKGMTLIQQEELRTRIIDLTAALELAPREQQTLREETQRLLAVAFLQQKAAVLGYDKVVSQDTINQFRGQVEMKRPELLELRNFPRIMPKDVLLEFYNVKEAKLFDEFFVLTWNPKQEQVAAVTDRVIKKDPILFGRFAFDPFYFYYIASWEDEACDLTFDKMVATLKDFNPDYEPEKIKPLSTEDAEYLIKAAQDRADLLAGTNARRYRSDALINALSHEDFSWASTKRLVSAIWEQYRQAQAKKKRAKRAR